MSERTLLFDPGCQRCPRLVAHLQAVRAQYPQYHAAPVAPFGSPVAPLLIVGLAPGLHGANATGRPFTGDFAGLLLYRTLFEFGFSDRPEALARDDGLRLIDCRVTNAVKCLPPQNKPLPEEIRRCNDFLHAELATVRPRLVLALGHVAHTAVIRSFSLRVSAYPFAHGRWHDWGAGVKLVDSYHCSRYNTQTGRLSSEMFRTVFAELRAYLDAHEDGSGAAG